jgi:hypothetical protein
MLRTIFIVHFVLCAILLDDASCILGACIEAGQIGGIFLPHTVVVLSSVCLVNTRARETAYSQRAGVTFISSMLYSDVLNSLLDTFDSFPP